jgi:hypothetical protein
LSRVESVRPIPNETDHSTKQAITRGTYFAEFGRISSMVTAIRDFLGGVYGDAGCSRVFDMGHCEAHGEMRLRVSPAVAIRATPARPADLEE